MSWFIAEDSVRVNLHKHFDWILNYLDTHTRVYFRKQHILCVKITMGRSMTTENANLPVCTYNLFNFQTPMLRKFEPLLGKGHI